MKRKTRKGGQLVHDHQVSMKEQVVGSKKRYKRKPNRVSVIIDGNGFYKEEDE